MQLKSFEVIGLLGREASFRLDFNEDINIITGRNGSGKTSVLKLLWYIMSGNILLALKEVNFKKATLETTEYECAIYRLSPYTCRIDWRDADGQRTFEDMRDEDGDVVVNAEDQANKLLSGTGSSVFLPTFRRIEGGFTLSERSSNMLSRAKGDIEESLVALSKRLTNDNHVFVAALSTVDVVSLLVRQYTDLSEEYNQLQQKTSQEIISKIKEFKQDNSDVNQLKAANGMLDEIRIQIEGMEDSREAIMRPLEAVRNLAMKLFRHSGIKLGKNLSFGDAANAINSDALSAGEKQMLSFIAYNAFYSDAVVLIDEPELSLHVDWQRQLFPILLGQQASNQFLIATHSPFIYSKYPDKEIQIDSDRGDIGQ
ncbi:AAA family ATPase [Nitrosovibrio sp. Nv4]|uniref:AAA family ATPase n=1 Tax=Nitrosovibrio sp. Nv4 TaxID=1945880 RepID=UPI000BC89C6C|nr:ATP-binding protein [Nitrosovibrio sp. Nv4]SOD40287.1 Predicted ATP-binding protein involved in virulence [Nitrosovibrio sp. Nv4]